MMKQQTKVHYKNRLDEITHQDILKEQVVLLGDCFIENYIFDDSLSDYIVYNNGIAGDTTEELLKSLYKRAIKFKPKKVFISIGSNDIGVDQRKVKHIYHNIIEIVETIKKRSSETEVFLVSVVPVNPAIGSEIAREYVDNRDNNDISMLNYFLKNYARKNRITFVDITKELKNDFYQLDLEYTKDGFHLNPQGYQIFSNLIKSYV